MHTYLHFSLPRLMKITATEINPSIDLLRKSPSCRHDVTKTTFSQEAYYIRTNYVRNSYFHKYVME